MKPRSLLLLLAVTAACGSTSTSSTSSTSSTAAQPPTVELPSPTQASAPADTSAATEPAPIAEPLTSYRFSITLGVLPDLTEELVSDPGTQLQHLGELAGEATTDPPVLRVFGELYFGPVDLLFDGTRWYDADDLGLELTEDDVEFFLAANGFLLPQHIAGAFEDAAGWREVGTEGHLGLPVTRFRRQDFVNEDEVLSGLAQLDVWRFESGEMAMFTAWSAVGDNTGFPVISWTITELNPALELVGP